MKIRLNLAICDGFGFCAEMLPELVSLDEWGFPVIADGDVPSPLVPAAKQVVKSCPRRALELVP
jgi:ferredoxin